MLPFSALGSLCMLLLGGIQLADEAVSKGCPERWPINSEGQLSERAFVAQIGKFNSSKNQTVWKWKAKQ